MEKVKIILVDDHVLLRNGLAGLVEKLGYEVLFECNNGQDLVNKIDKNNLPDVVLMDINMPFMDGYETAQWLNTHYPSIKILALSMYEDDLPIIRMLRNGARGYILKDAQPRELKKAIDDIITQGFYYSELVSGRLMHSIAKGDSRSDNADEVFGLNDRELQFLKLASTEMTYKEIAQRMHLSPRTIDGYREALFEKLHAKSRVGLVLFAIRHNIV